MAKWKVYDFEKMNKVNVDIVVDGGKVKRIVYKNCSYDVMDVFNNDGVVIEGRYGSENLFMGNESTMVVTFDQIVEENPTWTIIVDTKNIRFVVWVMVASSKLGEFTAMMDNYPSFEGNSDGLQEVFKIKKQIKFVSSFYKI
ncbi:MAG: hypothetical protein Hyperionvirus2_138 [Hyperionvirus sp.]|uniref:Uncharacterized protein n=1 Tax=Hyperionvirus sp. TaxID=2487770 RepID=A0A3G5A683_9VIRU|nr:MAG: hypothetical protein Hyperionvirus2_138 [Hyperionvirus sp.]